MIKTGAKKVVKRIAQEPIEILKKAREQVTGEYPQKEESQETAQKAQGPAQPKPDEKKLEAQKLRMLQALRAETEQLAQEEKVKRVQEMEEEIVRQQQVDIPKKPAPQLTSLPRKGLAVFRKRLGKNIEQRQTPST